MKIKWINIWLIFFVLCTFTLTGVVLFISLGAGKNNQSLVKTEIKENSISPAVNKVIDAVVVVESFSNNKAIGTGTGFIYQKEENKGFILTNNHVIEGANSFKVIMNDGQEITAKLIGKDIYSDIAILTIDAKYVKVVATLGKSSKSNLGDTVFTIGAPVGSSYSGTVTKGIISGKNRFINVNLVNNETMVMKVLQTDAAINPGNSGGPLLNINAEVIGINSVKLASEEIEGMGFAIPIEEILKYTNELESTGKIERPYIGFGLVDLNEVYVLYQLNIDPQNIISGVVIGQVGDNSPADKSGLLVGDVITKIDNVKVTSKAMLRYELYQHKPKESVKITYLRNNKEHIAKIMLVKQP